MDSALFELASLIGSAAFALSGWLVGGRKELDIMGAFILATLTGYGGGIIRDTLVNRQPYALTDITALYIILGTSMIAYFLKIHKYNNLERRMLFIVSDTIGLVSFSITGAIIAIEANLNYFGVCVLALLTASGGGVVRDVLVNDVPTLLKSDFYGSVAVMLASIMFVLNKFDMINSPTIAITFAFGLLVRTLALRYKWKLPSLKAS